VCSLRLAVSCSVSNGIGLASCSSKWIRSNPVAINIISAITHRVMSENICLCRMVVALLMDHLALATAGESQGYSLRESKVNRSVGYLSARAGTWFWINAKERLRESHARIAHSTWHLSAPKRCSKRWKWGEFLALERRWGVWHHIHLTHCHNRKNTGMPLGFLAADSGYSRARTTRGDGASGRVSRRRGVGRGVVVGVSGTMFV